MKTGLVNYRITASMDKGNVIVRRARKNHICSGGHDGAQNIRCKLPFARIDKGTVYVEYVGESTPYGGGKRYHVECAVQQGLIERIGVNK